jgi:hypothetical protein
MALCLTAFSFSCSSLSFDNEVRPLTFRSLNFNDAHTSSADFHLKYAGEATSRHGGRMVLFKIADSDIEKFGEFYLADDQGELWVELADAIFHVGVVIQDPPYQCIIYVDETDLPLDQGKEYLEIAQSVVKI